MKRLQDCLKDGDCRARLFKWVMVAVYLYTFAGVALILLILTGAVEF